MKSIELKNTILAVCFAVGAVTTPVFASADNIPMMRDECAKELLLSYFPEPIVMDALKKFNVPQDKWAGIVKSLGEKDKEVVKLVEKKASAMNPNPLKDTQQRQAAVKLFRDTLFEVFADAMKENGVEDQAQLVPMLDDIQQQKAKKFAMCMEKQKAQLQRQGAGTAGNASSEPEGDDDDSDEEEEDYSADNEKEEGKKQDKQSQEEKKLVSPQEGN